MCGIVGFVENRIEKKNILQKMMQEIIHRGPDGCGEYLDENVAIGHVRLSIIDLDGGKQPMYNEDSSLILTSNGEIYNFKTLKEELINYGHTFKSNSDSEVILHGFEQWGKDIVLKLRGMFAFAIWDTKNKSLFCARDYFGIKPFYYYKNNETFLFASEIKSFLKHPNFIKELNEEQLELYLTYQYSPGENTFFKGVKKLLPAHWLEYKNGKISIEQYWKPKFEVDNTNIETLPEEIETILKNSIEAHKISDVEVASFLSSGIDSSYIAQTSNVNKTFTVGFDNKKYSEIDLAKDFCKSINIENFAYKITPEDFWQNIGKIQYHMDEPLADAASAALYFVNKEAAKHVKVCLSGEGADELFGGYNTYNDAFTNTIFDKTPYKFRKSLSHFLEKLPPAFGINFLIRRSKPLQDRYIGSANIMPEGFKKRILKNYIGKTIPTDLSKPYFEQVAHLHPMLQMQYVDLHLWLVGDILLKADKMSMANSIELRVPFLDKEVFEVARKIPQEFRAGKIDTKIAFRQCAAKTLPKTIANRKKLGFPVPINDWLKDEIFVKKIKNVLNSDFANKFFDTKILVQMLDAHYNGIINYWRPIWCIYIFLVWYEEYFIKR